MALVVKHSFEHVASGQMQSYFQSVPGTRQPSQPQHSSPPSHNLDGRTECDEADFPSRSNAISQNQDSTVMNNSIDPSLLTDQYKLNIKSSEQEPPHDDVDPNSNRRKRRKITPKKNQKSEGYNTLDAYARLTASSSTTAKIDETTGQDGIVNGGPEEVPHSVTGGSPMASPRVEAAQTPKRRTPRKPKATSGSVDQSITDASSQPTPSPSKSKRSTPKKALALHTNGKLLSSPAKKSPVSARLKDTDNAPEKKSVPARNFKMRNGKFVQTMEVVLRYGLDGKDRTETGTKISGILSQPSTSVHSVDQEQGTRTHPLFSLGKRKAKNDPSISNSQATTQQKDPVAWKDIKFSSQKPVTFKTSESLRPIWPPLQIQHVGIDIPARGQHVSLSGAAISAKQKSRQFRLGGDENVLLTYFSSLRKNLPSTKVIQKPTKKHLTGEEMARNLASFSNTNHTHAAISSARIKLISETAAFDRGECPGPNIWPVQYAPTRWTEVLQPAAEVLHGWLSGLAVHNVQSGVDTSVKKQKVKTRGRKKRPKSRDSLADFVVGSDDEESNDMKVTKNVILITGPSGCGKTASVFAVAKELGFEIFEIHPGMRRSGKDIFDKVGDMAHNHLVQQGTDISRSSSVAPSDVECNINTRIDSAQTSVANFFNAKTASKAKTTEDVSIPRTKRDQKQSLILFEEVDMLFEDDRGFWAGVQNLSKASKRPIILTCNSTKDVPLDDLDLHDILVYNAVETNLATDYLQFLTSAEGHILDREALSTLYESKGRDLRAAMTELNFWCQMTVGSEYAGLDWMDQIIKARSGTNSVTARTFSEGTFSQSLDLMPQTTFDETAAIRFKQDALGISANEWCDIASLPHTHASEHQDNILEALDRLSIIADAQSVIDILNERTAPEVAGAAAAICRSGSLVLNRTDTVYRYNQRFKQQSTSRMDILRTLAPITIEKPTFPPNQGRLAPSIDSPYSSVILDVAPYVRCIVDYDQRLERYRDEHFGSQGKARNTRAARAAAEGGDKASTRTERWFPKDVDFAQVRSTAGEWPIWYGQSNMDTHDTSMNIAGE